MSTKSWQRVFSFIVLVGLLLSLTVPGTAQAKLPAKELTTQAVQEDPLAKIEKQVLDEITANGKTDFFVTLKEQADLSAAENLNSKLQKGEFVFNTLRATAERTQKDLRSYLDQQGVRYRSYYIANTILVTGGSQDLALAVASRSDVGSVTANHKYQLDKPIKSFGPDAPALVEPNLSFVNADDVWAMGITGSGVVLAGNDTGLAWDQPAIQPHYRGWNGSTADHNYNWWDATGMYPLVPDDGFGHGTHTTGTMVGDDGAGNQIGMAPGAQTIHCKNMDDDGGGIDAWFLECFEWDLAPWDLSGANADVTKAPDAVNNSWGYGGGGVEVFRTAINNLQAAGTLVEVSAGNEGSFCTTLRSPGDYQEVMTTGSVNHAGGTMPGTITGFSSRGPSILDGNYFPDIMAPGENIRSAVPWDTYEYWSGTSMAGPHTTGLIGLLWSANPALRGLVETTIQMIKDTAVPLTGQMGSNCGGDYTLGPNNDWGYGTFDALAAVQMALAFGGIGTLEGTVTNSATSAPIAGVEIVASLSLTQSFQTTTNAAGLYSMSVFSGTYTIDATAFGYFPEQATGVYVGEDQTVTQDFALDPAPSSVVTVTVVDANTGWPLYAVSTLGGTPWDPVWTDPVTGQFSLIVPNGTDLTLGVDAWTPGYLHQDLPIGIISGDMSILVELQADILNCVAPGYTYSEEVVASDTFDPSGFNGNWTVINNGGDCVWRDDNPAGRENNTGGSGLFAIADSDYCGPEGYMDTELRSPTFNASGISTAVLRFNSDYPLLWTGQDVQDVDVYNGTDWTNVLHRVGVAYPGPEAVTVDVTAAAGGATNAQVRFHYYNAYFDYWWSVDNYTVLSAQCIPPDNGGLVVGNVYDTNEGNPLAGATVENDAGGSTLTAATVDPNVDDSFYVLFTGNELADLHDLTASLEGYGPDTETVDVIDGDTVAQDFYLPAGHLLFNPLDMHVTLDMGTSATEPLTISNDGDTSATFAIAEVNKGFDPVALEYHPPAQSAGSASQLSQFGKAEASGKPAPLAPAADILLNQPPNQLNGLFADSDCSLCPTGQQSIAENFSLPDGMLLGQIVFWTGYFPADTPIDPDLITVIIHQDQGGSPGPVVYSEANVAYERAQTGIIIFGVHEWVHTLTLDSPVDLAPGVYWVEIYNDTSGNGDQFFWETGDLDPVYGLPGSAWTTATPGSSWNYDGFTDLSIQLLTAEGDVPWLSEDPITGTVSSGGNQVVDVTFNAGVSEVSQPGDYFAQLKISSDTPYPATTIPVTMTVIPPDTYGKLEGTVTGLGYCDLDEYPIEGATVYVMGSTGMTWTLETDEFGYYQVWMDQANTPVTIQVSADEHVGDSRTGVVIVGQETTTEDFDLRWLEPCVSATPASMEVELLMGAVTTTEMTLSNSGAADATFSIKEKDNGYSPVAKVLIPASDGNFAHTPASIGRAPKAPQASSGEINEFLKQTLAGEPAFAIDVYPNVNLVYIPDTTNPGAWNIVGPVTGSYFGGDFLDGDFSVLYVVDYDTNSLYTVDTTTGASTLVGPAVPGGGESWTGLTGSSDGTLYGSATTCVSSSTLYTVDPGTGATTPVGTITNGPCIIDIAINADGDLYGVDIVNDNLVQIDTSTGAGTIIGSVGVDANFAQGMDFEEESGILYWAAYTFAGELRIIDTTTGNSTSVGSFPGGDEVDSLAFATGGVSDVLWLSEDPISGTLPADVGVQSVEVTFDSSGVPQPGKYFATLKVKSDDPFNGMINVPVTMTVAPTADYGILVGTVTSPGYCEVNPGPIEGAEILIESASGMTYTVVTDANGEYSRYLQVADGPYIVSVNAVGYEFDFVSGVVIPSLGTTVVDFDLRWLEPCVSAVPPELVVDVALGYERTVLLDLLNEGAGSSTFKITEMDGGSGLAKSKYQPPAQSGDSASQLTQFGKANLSGTPALSAPAAEVLLNQPPNGVNGLFADSDCALCGGQQSIAENFALPDGATIGQIIFWTGYFPLDVPQEPDQITVIFHEDVGGFPGAAIYTEANVVYEREQTGLILFGVHEWVHTLTLALPVSLDPGNYWVEIYNSTIGNSDQFFWETGDLDPVYGLPGSAWTTATPGETWNYDGSTDLSIQLVTADIDVPWLAEDPITGTIAHDSSFTVDVTFTAFTTMTVGGVYTASLIVKSDDPVNPKLVVPVTMNVVEPAYGVEVSADQVGSGEPGGVVTYTVTVTNTSNFAADSFNVTLGSHAYTTTLSTALVGPVPMGGTATFVVTVVIPDDALDGDSDTVQITVTSVGDPTKSAITNVTTNVVVVPPSILPVYLPLIWKVYP